MEQSNATPAVVEIEATVTAEDFGAAWSYVPLFRVGRRAYLSMTLVGITFIVLALVQDSETGWLTGLGIVVGNLAVVWFGVSVKRAWIRGAASQWSGSARFRLDHAGFELATPIRRVQLAWTAVPQYVETPQAFLVHIAEHGFALLPKRACEGGELDAVRQILETQVIRKPRRGIGWPLLVGVVFVIFIVVWQAIATISAAPREGEPSSAEDTQEPTR